MSIHLTDGQQELKCNIVYAQCIYKKKIPADYTESSAICIVPSHSFAVERKLL